ncbi:MAG: hypothetical protein VX255_02550, partial [Candidatus Latescibacterota bacterium]|nr:hypothetical protein [Candidatus Latescibacterota bacterium]
MSRIESRIAMSLDKSKTLGRQLICLALLGLSVTAQAGENGWTSTGPDAVVNLVVPDDSQQRLYAGSDRGIFTRDMNDSVWTVLAGGALAEHNVLSLAVDTTDARLYAGTDQGLFVSANAGTLWTQATEPGSGIMSLATGLSAGRVYAGTFGRGVYTSVDGGI